MFLHESPPEEVSVKEERTLPQEDTSDDFAPEADARNFGDEPEDDIPAGQDPRMWHAEGPSRSPGLRIRSLIKSLFDASSSEQSQHEEPSSRLNSSVQQTRNRSRKLKDMDIMNNDDDITKS